MIKSQEISIFGDFLAPKVEVLFDQYLVLKSVEFSNQLKLPNFIKSTIFLILFQRYNTNIAIKIKNG